MQEEFIAEHLVEMCKEMVEYHDTSRLPEHSLILDLASRLYREIAEMTGSLGVTLDPRDYRDIEELAKQSVYHAAVARVAAMRCSREGDLKSLGYEEVPDDLRTYPV